VHDFGFAHRHDTEPVEPLWQQFAQTLHGGLVGSEVAGAKNLTGKFWWEQAEGACKVLQELGFVARGGQMKEGHLLRKRQNMRYVDRTNGGG